MLARQVEYVDTAQGADLGAFSAVDAFFEIYRRELSYYVYSVIFTALFAFFASDAVDTVIFDIRIFKSQCRNYLTYEYPRAEFLCNEKTVKSTYTESCIHRCFHFRYRRIIGENYKLFIRISLFELLRSFVKYRCDRVMIVRYDSVLGYV